MKYDLQKRAASWTQAQTSALRTEVSVHAALDVTAQPKRHPRMNTVLVLKLDVVKRGNKDETAGNFQEMCKPQK